MKELAWPPVRWFSHVRVLEKQKCVVAEGRLFGVVRFSHKERRACFKNAKLGCALDSGPFALEDDGEERRKLQTDEKVFVDATGGFKKWMENTTVNGLIEEHFKVESGMYQRALLLVDVSEHPAKILYERYGDGFNKDMKQAGWSMSKSVFSMIVGALMHKVPERFPQGFDTVVSHDATLENMLRMSDGFAFDEKYTLFSDPVEMLFRSAMSGADVRKPPREKPGKCFRYSSQCSNRISEFIRRDVFAHAWSATGGDVAYEDMPRNYLFDKIDIKDGTFEMDPSGTFVASSFTMLRPRDWIKLGILLSNDGVWPVSQERILAPDFMKKVNTMTKTSMGTYGLQFWLGGNPFTEKEMAAAKACDALFPTRGGGRQDQAPPRLWYSYLPKKTYFMTGFEGNYLMIFPNEKKIMLRLGATPEGIPPPFGPKWVPHRLFGPLIETGVA